MQNALSKALKGDISSFSYKRVIKMAKPKNIEEDDDFDDDEKSEDIESEDEEDWEEGTKSSKFDDDEDY